MTMRSVTSLDKSQKRRIYSIWSAMRYRCNNQKHWAYARYGGRGIKVCDRWSTPECFYQDMGFPPVGTTLDRIDNDGGYSPDNCRWATKAEQVRNKCNNRFFSAFGDTKILAEWARDPRCVVSYAALAGRVNGQDWSPEGALTRPVKLRPRGKGKFYLHNHRCQTGTNTGME